jgi:hypothetical protein
MRIARRNEFQPRTLLVALKERERQTTALAPVDEHSVCIELKVLTCKWDLFLRCKNLPWRTSWSILNRNVSWRCADAIVNFILLFFLFSDKRKLNFQNTSIFLNCITLKLM